MPIKECSLIGIFMTIQKFKILNNYMPEKAVFFFGAGADAPYGLPSGGEFALEIFRTIGDEDKKRLRDELNKIESRSHQAQWLPSDYKNSRVTVFGKSNFDTIISSTLENKRDIIISSLSNFDVCANNVKSQFLKLNIDIDLIHERLGCRPGEQQYSTEIKLNPNLQSNNIQNIFDSSYLSALIYLIQEKKLTGNELNYASILARSFIEIFIGALGQDLVHSLNNGVFLSAPDNLSFLDDIGGMFNLDYRKIGLDALSHILAHKPFLIRKQDLNENTDSSLLIIEFYLRIAELIYSTFLDYQSLVDSHFRYLYQPKTEWAKFCKISTFLYAVERYLKTQLGSINIETTSYYEDISQYNNCGKIAIGTSNYTSLVTRSNNKNIFYLNGSLSEFYDPYKNEITDNENYNSLLVPFIFTQSGTKPMTSIKMCERYYKFYKSCLTADRIIVLGYGFNSDDGHINTLIRSLIDENDKSIDIIDYKIQDYPQLKRKISKNIRCSNPEKLRLHSIDSDRQIDGQMWLNKLFGQ